MRTLDRVRGPLLGVTVFALVSVLLTATIAGTLAGGSGNDRITLTAVFRDASGLRAGDDVRIAGVRVGRVESRELHGSLAHVRFTVDADQRVYETTRAEISYLNLLGQRYLSLRRPLPTHGSGSGAAVGTAGSTRAADGAALGDGDTIPVRRTSGALDLTALFNAFRPLFDVLKPAEVNDLAREVVAVLQGEGPTLTHLLRQTAQLTEHLADRDRVIDQVVANMTLVMETTASHRTEISELVDQLGSLVSGLAEDRRELGGALVSMQELTDVTSDLVHESGDPLTADVARLREVGTALTRQTDLLGAALDWAPVMLEAYARSMSYGSWLNTYICSLSVKLPGEAAPTVSGDVRINSEACA